MSVATRTLRGIVAVVLMAGVAMAQRPQGVRVVTGTVVRVALQLSPSAAGMHAMEVRVGDGSEMPMWFYDRQDKDLGRFKPQDVVEIRYTSVPDRTAPRKRDRHDIREIRKLTNAVPVSGAAATTGGGEGGTAGLKDFDALKACVEKGDLAAGHALVDRRAKASGGYQAFGNELRDAGLPALARYCYETVLTEPRVSRAAAYKARKSLVALFQGSYHPDLSRIADGSYEGRCLGYLGPNIVRVTVKNHAITDVDVKCPDNRPGSAVKAIPDAIVARQGIRDVDAITGATISSHAIMAGAAAALKDAER